jgi:Asp/Glu/hydantoin racemase
LTWPFPTHYQIVKDARPNRIMGRDPDPELLAPLLDATRELAAHGVRAITTSCGFLAVFQQELATAVAVPVVTSALLQVPLVSRLIGPERRVAVLTERPHLTDRHFRAVGWSPTDVPVVVVAMPPNAIFPTVYIDNNVSADSSILESELVQLAQSAVDDYPDVGALVLECTNFVPYSQAMRRAVGLPVFDLYTAVMQTYLATTGREFSILG